MEHTARHSARVARLQLSVHTVAAPASAAPSREHTPLVRSLALDLTTGDLLVENGRCRLTRTAAEYTRQRAYMRLGLWQGEYPLDLSKGIPYRRYLGESGTFDALSGTLRTAILTCPGMASLDAFTASLSTSTRGASISFAGRASDGEPIQLDDFAVAA